MDAAEGILRAGKELSLGAVAQEVGIGRTAIYRYVSGADELVAILATRDFPDWTQAVADAMAQAGGVDGDHRARIIAWGMENIRQGRAADHNWLASLGRMELSDEAKMKIAHGHREIEQLLRVELEALEVSAVDVVSHAAQAVVASATAEAVADNSDEFYERCLGAIVDAALETQV